MNHLDTMVDDIVQNGAKPREALVAVLITRREELTVDYKQATQYADLLQSGIGQLTSLIEQLEAPPL